MHKGYFDNKRQNDELKSIRLSRLKKKNLLGLRLYLLHVIILSNIFHSFFSRKIIILFELIILKIKEGNDTKMKKGNAIIKIASQFLQRMDKEKSLKELWFLA